MAQPVAAPQSTAIVQKPADKLGTLKHLFEAKKGAISAVLPKHLTVDRIIKLTLSAISRNPELLACSQESIFFACVQAAEVGLEFGNMLGHAYLVPFRNKHTKKMEAQFIPGYRGLIALARRSGQILSIEAHVVYAKDAFAVRYGSDAMISHTPYDGDDDPGELRRAYAVAHLRDTPKPQFDVMTRRDLEAVRAKSAAANSGPWADPQSYPEMCKKTVVKRLWKMLPMSTEMAKALAADNAAETGEVADLSDLFDAAPEAEIVEGPPPAAALKDKLRAKAEESTPRQPGED